MVRYLCLHEAYCVHPNDVEKRIPLGKTSLGPKARMDCPPPPTHGHVFAARTSDLSLLAPASTDPRWGHRDEPRPRLPPIAGHPQCGQAEEVCSSSAEGSFS